MNNHRFRFFEVSKLVRRLAGLRMLVFPLIAAVFLLLTATASATTKSPAPTPQDAQGHLPVAEAVFALLATAIILFIVCKRSSRTS